MCQYSVFYEEYENEKKTGQKNLTFPDGDLNPGFLNKTFPPKISILREIRSIELKVLKKSWLYCEFVPLTDSGWPGGRKVLSDSQKQSIIFWSTWNCTQCQADGEENVGWARHELPEGGGEVYVWLGAMIIDHGTDFFRYFNRITYQSLVLTYHTGYAMNFLLWWVKIG